MGEDADDDNQFYEAAAQKKGGRLFAHSQKGNEVDIKAVGTSSAEVPDAAGKLESFQLHPVMLIVGHGAGPPVGHCPHW